MIGEDGKFWRPRNRAALVEGIADALFKRDAEADSWDAMAELIVQYLEQAQIRVPKDDDLPAHWQNPAEEKRESDWPVLTFDTRPATQDATDADNYLEYRMNQAVTEYVTLATTSFLNTSNVHTPIYFRRPREENCE